MEYFAGLDVSMEETHVCVVTRNGTVMHEARVPSTPASIAAALARAPACRWVLFETARGRVKTRDLVLFPGVRGDQDEAVC